jgi:hypothetical protein
MTIPNFFKYYIYSNGVKIGTLRAPCKKVAKIVWRECGLPLLYPNAKIKFAGLNIGAE